MSKWSTILTKYNSAVASVASVLLTEEYFENGPRLVGKMSDKKGKLLGKTVDSSGKEHKYYEGDGVVVDSLSKADLLLSKTPSGVHYPVLDLDISHLYIPSSQPGHAHLLLDVPVNEEDYFELLKLMAKCGIIENGYYAASKAMGYSAVRLPWIKKVEVEEKKAPAPYTGGFTKGQEVEAFFEWVKETHGMELQAEKSCPLYTTPKYKVVVGASPYSKFKSVYIPTDGTPVLNSVTELEDKLIKDGLSVAQLQMKSVLTVPYLKTEKKPEPSVQKESTSKAFKGTVDLKHPTEAVKWLNHTLQQESKDSAPLNKLSSVAYYHHTSSDFGLFTVVVKKNEFISLYVHTDGKVFDNLTGLEEYITLQGYNLTEMVYKGKVHVPDNDTLLVFYDEIDYVNKKVGVSPPTESGWYKVEYKFKGYTMSLEYKEDVGYRVWDGSYTNFTNFPWEVSAKFPNLMKHAQGLGITAGHEGKKKISGTYFPLGILESGKKNFTIVSKFVVGGTDPIEDRTYYALGLKEPNSFVVTSKSGKASNFFGEPFWNPVANFWNPVTQVIPAAMKKKAAEKVEPEKVSSLYSKPKKTLKELLLDL